jgi:Protein of unknown function (DUF1631)
VNSSSLSATALLNTCVQRVKAAFRSTLDRCTETLATAAAASSRAGDRENLRVAMYELGRRQASFAMTFNERLDESVAHEVRRMEGHSTSQPRDTTSANFWETLTLVSDSETDLEVAGERIAQAISQDAEWELRRLDGLMMGALRSLAVASEPRNPLRPDIVGKAIAAACSNFSDSSDVTAVLRQHMSRAWAAAAPAMYKEMADALQHAGVRAADTHVKTVQGPGNEMGVSAYQTGVHGSNYMPVGVTSASPSELARGVSQLHGGRPSAGIAGGDYLDSSLQVGGLGPSGRGPAGGVPSGAGGMGSYVVNAGVPGSGGHVGSGANTGHGTDGGGDGRRSSGLGYRHSGRMGLQGHFVSSQADAQLVALLKRLTMLAPMDLMPGSGASVTPAGTAGPGGSALGAGVPMGAGRGAGAPVTAQGTGHVTGPGGLANLIAGHRDELRQAATGALDHMVIDVVASLFDQILSDAKVPPQMARQIARLQLPVLRVALIDATFFSSRRHPVRQFVNRVASLALAFDDFAAGPGQKFHEMVRTLVDEIVSGDFDQMQQYQQKLAALESFAAGEAKNDAESSHRAPSLIDHREAELLLQQRYVQQLRTGLAGVQMDDFLRDFITQVWSQALMRVGLRHGPDHPTLKSLRTTGRDLMLSVQPKGSPGERKAFLVRLPQLMKELDAGLDLIAWPADAKREFVSQLRAAQAAALNQPPMRVLDYNLLSKQLEALLATPLPTTDQAPHGVSALPILEKQATPAFTQDEAKRIGLVDETQVDWDGTVDIDVGAVEAEAEEPAATELDINIDGLPPAEPAEPRQGAALMDHVQVGFSYRMFFENRWHKVRLAHISPGRTFFVFTRGAKHEHAISMTARMIARLCESGRLRTFENADLIERATARARRQLAAIRAGSGQTTAPASL